MSRRVWLLAAGALVVLVVGGALFVVGGRQVDERAADLAVAARAADELTASTAIEGQVVRRAGRELRRGSNVAAARRAAQHVLSASDQHEASGRSMLAGLQTLLERLQAQDSPGYNAQLDEVIGLGDTLDRYGARVEVAIMDYRDAVNELEAKFEAARLLLEHGLPDDG